MKNRLLAMFFAVILLIVSVIPAFAAEEKAYIVDAAGLLTNEEAVELQDILSKVSEESDLDIAVLTIDSLDGESLEDFASEYYEEIGYDDDGILLLVSMEDRDVLVEGFGELGEDAISESDATTIIDEITPALSDGDYFDAFVEYSELADDCVYDATHFNFLFNILISLGIGIVISLIVVLIMKSQLKSVRFQSAAANYLKEGSMKVTNAHEQFLYRHVDRVAKPKENSSSSGSGHSASGKF